MEIPLSPGLAAALKEDRVRRVLVLRTDRVGDLLWTTPALRALRRRFAHVAVLTNPYARPVLAGNPNVDEVLTLDRAKNNPWTTRRRERSAAAALRERKFDVAVVIARGKRENVRLARAVGIPFIVGMEPGLDGGFVEDAPAHQVALDLEVVKALGCESDSMNLDWFVSQEDARWAEEFLSAAGWKGDAPLLGVHPGCGEFIRHRWTRAVRRAKLVRRLWFADRWTETLGGFLSKTGGRVLLTGAPVERPVAEPMLAALGGSAVDAVGKTTLGRLAALIARCSAYVSPDTGPMHMAAALGTPLVALYGYQDPAVTGPVGDRGPIRVIRHPFPCSPCHGWVKEACVDNICMKAIRPDEVLAAVLAILR